MVRLLKRTGRVPLLGRLVRGLWDLSRAAGAELGHVRLAFTQLRRLDALIVTGGTQFDDTQGGAWGHPYALFKWAVLARLTRVRFVILSVGTGTVGSGLSRFFLGTALRLGTYRSFRDAGSADFARRLSTRADGAVVPDLALGEGRLRRRSFPRSGARLIVGVNPIAHRDPRSNQSADAAAYYRLMSVYAAFVTWLAEQRHTVVLFATDSSDRSAVNDLQARLRPDILARYGPDIRHAHVDNVDELIEELSNVHCVVASRLHGIILSHSLGVPVLAMAHNRKVIAYMRDLRQLEHCIEIEHADAVDLAHAFASLADDLPDTAAEIYAATELSRRMVAAQYERVFSNGLRRR